MSDWKNPFAEELVATAAAMCAPGKGLLAADESTGTIGKRFDGIKVENTLENRRAYRELLFTTPGAWENHISGVIMYEETLKQSASDGRPFPELLKSKGILTGIKVDKGTVVLPGTDGETTTLGLDGLGARCAEYYKLGARFAKWRAVLKISSNGCPSELAVHENAYGLARYAVVCLENGLVPIVEPEVLCDGSHSIETCAAVSERVFAAVVKALSDHHVCLDQIVLKPNMITPGSESGSPASAARIAELTVRTLRRTLPPAVKGVLFLSGGQTEEEATLNLNAMNKNHPNQPWALTFSYGRALQATVLKTWQGKPENVAKAQEALFARAKANSEAALGVYEGSAASSSANESLHVANYVY
eukprot:TRINITY_DN1883_c0_g4_i1.p1 TRINITY_DN1883_c0_g4~~TRINITY_DN1883_c0_g4_i1.p1  ORF type:complete len:361 (-),score=56.35 TRINITY_DN1883_c0_g4_i1:111-1193(-)